MKSRPVIGITIGEPAGIGPEIIARALRSPDLPKGFTFWVIGSAEGIKPGRLTEASARVALGALQEACDLWETGELAAIVTAPVQKENLASVGFRYPGQTEFFAAACGMKEDDAIMVMTDPRLTVGLASTHCSLQSAVAQLNTAKLVRVGRELDSFLKAIGRRHPRLAMAGLNPHAGENGLFGSEEKRIMEPALRELWKAKINATGPHAPDTVFHRAVRDEFDAVICAYHDQGLIPFKLLAFATGVNVTLGLPLIRTSPDHGTALDLAGKNRADARSMIEAIRLACRLVQARSKIKVQKRIAKPSRFVKARR